LVGPLSKLFVTPQLKSRWAITGY